MTIATDEGSRGANGYDSDLFTAMANDTVAVKADTEFQLSNDEIFGTITFSGTGFTYDGNTPTGGLITGYTDGFGQIWSGFSVPIADMWNALKTGNVDAFTALFFGGDDTFTITSSITAYNGYGGNDTFNVSGPGPNGVTALSGGDGNDVFNFTGNYTNAFFGLSGGDGSDVVHLDGDISTRLSFVTSIERITAAAGHNYTIDVNDTRALQDGRLTIDGSALGASDKIVVAQPVPVTTTGTMTILGGAGDDFLESCGGHNTITAGAGNDTIASYGVFDRVDGGDGSDTVGFFNVETNVRASLAASGLQDFTGNGAQARLISVENLTGGERRDTLIDGSGNNTLSGGDGDDTLYLVHGGADVAHGDANNDVIVVRGNDLASDTIDGGDGKDELVLSGDYAAGVTFTATGLTGIEIITLGAGHSYKLTILDQNIVTTTTVNAAHLGAGDSANFDGGAETFSAFRLTGGAGSDTLTGGAGNDIFTGGLGGDVMTGNAGRDHFVYHQAAESTGATFDTVTGYDATKDAFDLPFVMKHLNTAVAGGTLSAASFDGDLSAALGSGQLGTHHAVLFTPNAGDYAGDTFLVVDLNNTPGYQPGADLVIRLDQAVNMSHFGISDFI